MKTNMTPTQATAKPQVAHMPTPLEVTDWNGQPAIKCQRGLVALMSAGYGQTRTDDAAFIVRAVNIHEELWNVLTWLQNEIDENGQGNLPDSLATAVRKAVAKADGVSEGHSDVAEGK